MTASCFKEFSIGALKLYMEFKGYNHRFLDIKINLPQSLSFLEKEFLDKIRNVIKRGHVNFSLKVSNNLDVLPRLNVSFLEEVLKEIGKITRREEKIEDWKIILSNPQVFILEPKNFSEEEIAKIKEEFEELLFVFQEERRNEGENIAKSVEKCLRNIEENLRKIEGEDSNWRKEIKDLLQRKIEEWNITIEKDRLLQEMALILMKADINEELERLKSFLDKFKIEMNKDEKIGKNLDFIIQEMIRETNTLSSKTSKTKIIEYALEIKGELEKIRELISNVE
ncbi:MAG: YicC family protein [Dictyoglomaceae bacterium]